MMIYRNVPETQIRAQILFTQNAFLLLITRDAGQWNKIKHKLLK